MLVLAIMVITTQEALRAVPLAIREASFAVGATPWQTIRHHVLPVASPAILTGSVLTLARAFGSRRRCSWRARCFPPFRRFRGNPANRVDLRGEVHGFAYHYLQLVTPAPAGIRCLDGSRHRDVAGGVVGGECRGGTGSRCGGATQQDVKATRVTRHFWDKEKMCQSAWKSLLSW